MKIFGKTPQETGILHFIGAGGIGMSGLMEALHSQNFTVTGSDSNADFSPNVARLRKLGMAITHGHSAENVQNSALTILSTAIKPDNVERQAAEKQNQKIVHRADILAEITKNYNTIAVTGTHGKTSTTALIYTALASAGADVGLINGGVLTALNTNVKLPKTKKGWLVVEADESDASFTKFTPDISVITNIEPEHMETYGNEKALLKGFKTFMDNTKDIAVLCEDDPHLQLLATQATCDVVTYGLDELADIYATTPIPQGRAMAFDATLRGGKLEDIVVNAPGNHMVQNALSALAVAQILSLNIQQAANGLANFQGVERRFSYVGTFHGADIIDDYAHHPTEISAMLEATKKVYAHGKVVAVIQPHRFTRLRDLWEDFATCTKVADAVILLPVYTAGEAEIDGITHTALAEAMRAHTTAPVMRAQNEADLPTLLEPYAEAENALLFMGAGSISNMAKMLDKT